MNARQISNRRDFVKGALMSAAAVRAGAGVLAGAEQSAPAAKSKVVIARDALLRGTGSTVDSGRMLSLLDRAMQALFDRDRPIEAWRKLVHPGETVGLKVNTLGGRGISTNVYSPLCARCQLSSDGVAEPSTNGISSAVARATATSRA